MAERFPSKIWKVAAISSYLGMHIGVILISAVIPLAFICLGERKLEDLAVHSASVKLISRWLIGLGGITIVTSTMTIISTFSSNRVFRITMTLFTIVNVLLAVIVLIWGLVANESRKSFLRKVWNDMQSETKTVIQNYYSCCGFDEHGARSCFADQSQRSYWPDGCYARVTSLSVPSTSGYRDGVVSMEFHKPNVLLMGFSVTFLTLIIVQTVTAALLTYGLFMTGNTDFRVGSEAEIYVNDDATDVRDEKMKNSLSARRSIEKVDVDVTDRVCKRKRLFSEIPNLISSTMENAFYFLGVKVGRNPKMTILLSLLLAGSTAVGLLNLREQPTGSEGFLSENSQISREYTAYREVFYRYPRNHFLLIVDDDNLLTSSKFKAMLRIDQRIRQIKGERGGFFNICSSVAGNCKQRSLFELWNYNETIINQLTSSDILEKLNSNFTSPVFQDNVDVTTVLGDISRSPEGTIVGAKAHLMHYATSYKDDKWELQFVNVGNVNYEEFSVYVNARGSRINESVSYEKELPLLFGGFGLIFIYIILMTGKFSLLQHRTYIALSGVFTAGLAMAAGIGFSSSLGFKWTVIHLAAPFLVIGIGVDDMFIIIQAWNTVDDNPELKNESLEKKTGHALKAAGVSITVTSVTDLVAFAVGAASELESFASFSIYVAVCIILLFFLQCTFFLACTVLDQRRREERYDACLACCYKHDENYRPSKCSERELFQKFFQDCLGRLVQFPSAQLIVIFLTLSITSIMTWGFTKLPISFDPDWYLPQDSYLIAFNQEYEKYFSSGQKASVCVLYSDFYSEREKLHRLYEKLKQNEDLDPRHLMSWFENYVQWMETDKNASNVYESYAYSDAQHFYATVAEFISTKGKYFATDIAMNASGAIIGSRFHIRHKKVADDIENVDIMDSVHDDCESIEFTGSTFPTHFRYFNNAIMKIIRKEVYRNLGITLLCVFIMVLPMIASIQMSFWIVICVVFTIIDVAGSMYFAGLTIETCTIITLLLSVGLAVDYAAHVAHKFLTLRGTRRNRVRVTLGQIGPAVFNGGFSTFLALVLLSATDTYSYKVFFTVFVCVVAFGLWNGLIFLPCVLGVIGPPPHVTATEALFSQQHKKELERKEPDQTDIART